ncbi:ATG16 domain-containing protein [Heracleum sosnowskyi]|uniref:ATG16 domain-containing protein n=1 Tax=Heracleum sosnowskyi TaxID=360622 RepID=A0AAD8ML13_9APIA|nr:ATG16 domain-containing protein [Heracleum sosnowskyi]
MLRNRFNKRSSISSLITDGPIQPISSLGPTFPTTTIWHADYAPSPRRSEEEEVAVDAIKHALKALWKRHLVEEGAHGPAFVALSRPYISQGSEWKEKAENFETELQQCYRAQSRLSGQLVVEVAESRALKSLLQGKQDMIARLQNDCSQSRDECTRLKELLDEKMQAVELLTSENQEVRAQLEEARVRADTAQAENRMLIDRWMAQKMQDAEKLNEANAVYEEMLDKLKGSSIEQLARQQVDGVVRQSEEGAKYYVESTIPTVNKHKISAHQGGCAALLFEYNSNILISGGQDQTIKMWDTSSGSLSRTLHGCLGSVLDLAITHDNSSIIAASSSNKLFVWDKDSGRLRHTLTGHADKVCAVDVSKFSSRHVASAAYDRTIKIWDLQKGYCNNTIIFPSNCNALSFGIDGHTICSGHVDGNLRLWDSQTGKLLSEVAAHSLAITSISLSRNGNVILTSGRDNVHNLFDMRTLEVCKTLRASGSRMASNWSRSCISADDNYVAAGSADGSISVWSISKASVVSTLKEHNSSVLCCSWSGLGKPLTTAHKSGTICTWT